MRMAYLLQPILIVVVILSVGCASLDQPISELPKLSLIDRPRWRQKIQDDRELAKRFIACSSQAHGGQSGAEPAGLASQDGSSDMDLAPAKLVDRVVKHLDLRLKNDSKERPDFRAQLTQLIEIDREKIKLGQLGSRLKAHLGNIEPGLGLGLYAKLLAAAPQLVEHLHARIRDDEDPMAKSDSLFERLLVAYNRAYFGELNFKAALGGQSATGPKDIKGEIRTASDGFVDRNGTTFAFPGLSANLIIADKPFHLQSGSADSRRVASDLTRLFFEALFDAAFQVPAIEGATAWKLEGYPQFDAATSPISTDDLAKVTTHALRGEAAALSRVGEFVRGGGGLGINNETLASVIETAAGVTAKKLAEHELFCYYQVRAGK